MESTSATTAQNSKNRVFLGIGGNLGDRIANLQQAVELIDKRIGQLSKISSIYLSEPWGFSHKKYFTNIIVELYTRQNPEEVLSNAQTIEYEMKRRRTGQGYQGRTMDIDILFYNDSIIDTDNLIVPHPRICQRLFVLLPMSEIYPNFRHPQTGQTMQELAKLCTDESKIKKVGALAFI